jgi:cation diffusion facilitator CzcD-associated flavoprotein CzcO
VTFHYEINRYVSLGSQVNKAIWDEAGSKWTVSVQDQGDFECEILINSGGILNNVQYPKLNGLDSFHGPLLHTAAWNDNVDLTGKRIAIIGAGASAIQTLPVVAKVAERCDIYIRTPSWITSPAGTDLKPGNLPYTEEEKRRFRDDYEFSVSTRKGMETGFNKMFKAFVKGSDEQITFRGAMEKSMMALIPDQELQEKLIPKFEAGCRRINPGEPYLEALQRPNVRPVFDGINEVTSEGIIAGGQTRNVDVIITATGFDTSFRPRFSIIGREGCDLRELWRDDPIAYFGLAVSGFPNYLMFLGPNTPISNGSLMGTLEATADYFIRMIEKLLREGAVSFEVRDDVQADFDEHTQDLMKSMVWTGGCRSWYKGEDGKVRAIWPGSSLHYREVLESNRWEDFRWRYKGNRFAHWGQGFSRQETTVKGEGQDLAYYIEKHEPLPLEAYYLAAKESSAKVKIGSSFRREVDIEDEDYATVV